MKCYVNSMFLTVFVFVILITGTYAADPSLSFKAIEN